MMGQLRGWRLGSQSRLGRPWSPTGAQQGAAPAQRATGGFPCRKVGPSRVPECALYPLCPPRGRAATHTQEPRCRLLDGQEPGGQGLGAWALPGCGDHKGVLMGTAWVGGVAGVGAEAGRLGCRRGGAGWLGLTSALLDQPRATPTSQMENQTREAKGAASAAQATGRTRAEGSGCVWKCCCEEARE